MSKVATWKRIVHAAKSVLDSVGRAGDAETIGKWLRGRIKWLVTASATAWTWIVANPEIALLVGVGVLTLVGLFGETFAHMLTERRHLERKRKRARVTAPVPSPKPPQPEQNLESLSRSSEADVALKEARLRREEARASLEEARAEIARDEARIVRRNRQIRERIHGSPDEGR